MIKMIRRLFFLFLIFSGFSLSVCAHDFHGIEILGEYEIPSDFSFHVSTECSGHDYFSQLTAREDGWYAIMTQYIDIEENQDMVFRLHYVDIFDSNGDLIKELSFYTNQAVAVELTENSLDIYFHTFIISCNLETDAISGYQIGHMAAADLCYALREKQFSSGKWSYSVRGGFVSPVKVTRTNGEITENLGVFGGIRINPLSVILYVCLPFAVPWIIKIKKKNNG